ELLRIIKEGSDVFRGMSVVDRRVHVDGEAFRLCGFDRGNRPIEHSLLAHRLVVMLAQSVEVHREEEVRRWFKQMQLLFQEQRIGAQRHELLLRDQPLYDLADLAVNKRFAARDCHHGRAAFIGGIEAFLHRETAVEYGIRVIDLAATKASKVAAKERLQHQHQRVAFPPKQLLLEDIRTDADFLEIRDWHLLSLAILAAGKL